MSLFTNQNFITQILKQQGALDYFDQQAHVILQALIQAQTRKMVQTAYKFMQIDRRDYLASQDIQNAIKTMDHQDIYHHSSNQNKYKQENSQYYLSDPTLKNVSSFIQEQMKSLQSFSMPTLRGRFIYINKKIPKTNQNHQLKSLEDIKIIKAHQDQQKKKNFNIIRDQPQSQLTKEEIDYYNQIVIYLTNNAAINSSNSNKDIEAQTTQNSNTNADFQVKGCIINVLPLILKFILNLSINQNCIRFLLRAIQNKFVWQSLEFNMHQILILLMAYEGQKSFEVGYKIGYIVNRFGQKYPNLYDIFEQVQNSFCNITKKIGFQLITGIGLQLSLQKIKQIEQKSIQNNEQASFCMKALIQNWSGIQCLRRKQICDQYGYIFWYGNKQVQNDPYLSMY